MDRSKPVVDGDVASRAGPPISGAVSADTDRRPLIHSVKYRPDIDGLRAISVVAVILYHMMPHRLPAGGIGVDLFFVISGYLIGGIVLASVASGQFSFSEFYLRRIRRIAPAFIVMLLGITLAGLVPLYPWEAEGLAKSALAALACASNIYFYATSDYFAPASSSLPLLHTWSLGVEEQFYLIFPFIPLVITRAKAGRAMVVVLTLTAVLSLIIGQYQVAAAPTASFYLLPSRWFELMIGVIAARVPAMWLQRSALRFACASVGILLVVGSLVLVDPAKAFPGLIVLPACLGGALLIVSGQPRATPIHRALGVAPMRLVGLASYSLYLWHWPVIVLYRLNHVIGKLSIRDAAVVAIVTGVLGFGSWWFVERPFRRREMGARALLMWCGGFVAIAGASQLVILAADRLPGRFPPRALALARYANPSARFPMPEHHCILRTDEPVTAFDATHCLRRVPGKRNWLLVGDSHAAMLWSGLATQLPEVHFQVAAQLGCDIDLDPPINGDACQKLMHRVLIEHPRAAPPDAIVFTWRWQHIDEAGLALLAQRLRTDGVNLIIIGPTAGYTVPVARVLAESARRSDPGMTAKLLEPRLPGDDARLSAIAQRLGVMYLSPLRAMCPTGGGCFVTGSAGRPLYIDGDHYTAEGSAVVIRRLRDEKSLAGDALRQMLLDRQGL